MDSVEDNRAFHIKQQFPFPLLSDKNGSMSLAFGAVGAARDEYAQRYTFVIGPSGIVEQSMETKQPANQAETLLAGWV